MIKNDLWKAIESYRMAGGREEHWARRDALDAALDGMQAEINELRAENAAILRNNKELLDQRYKLMDQISALEASPLSDEALDILRGENKRLRAALQEVMDAVRFSNGVPTTVMQAEHMLDRISAAGVKARAALGEKSCDK